MKTSTAKIVLCAALAGQALAHPSPAGAQLNRRFFLFDIILGLFKGENNDELSPMPEDLPQEQVDFLKKTKEYVDLAATVKGERKGTFSKAGLCFKEHPCYAITNPKAASIGDAKEEVTLGTASELIDKIVSETEIVMSYELKNSMLAGWSTEAGGFVFQTQGDVGKKVDPKVIAGLFANLVQIQFNVNPDEQKANTIRGSKVLSEGETEIQSVCLYPKGADVATVQMFCVGVDLEELGDVPAGQAPSGAASSQAVSATATSLSSGTPQASLAPSAQPVQARDIGSFFNGGISLISTALCMFGSLLDEDTCARK